MSNLSNKKRSVRRHVKNSHLFESLAYLGSSNIPLSIDLMQYNATQMITKKIATGQKLGKEIDKKFINWFKIVGVADVPQISAICEDFGIQRYDIKDLLSGHQVSKVLEYPKTTFILLSSCFPTADNGLDMGAIAFILGENFIISIQENPYPIFDDVTQAIKESRVQIRNKGADFLLYILLRCVHSLYSDSIIKISSQIDEIEALLINQTHTNLNIMEFIQAKRAEYSILKRCIAPLRDEYINLLYNTRKLILPANTIYFNDFDDRLRTSAEELEVSRDSLRSLVDLYFNNNNMKMNEIMKRLTVVSTIFIPLTFMVGVWGMNFDFMPELKWQYGYFFSWATFVFIVIVACLFLKKKKWL